VDLPACSPWALGVGSVDVGVNKISNYSNISNRLSLLAPAGFETANVTDDPAVKNAYFTFGGTSQATPVAAALFAIGKSIKPDATNDELRGIARMTAVSVDDKIAKDNKIIQFENFVKRLLEPQTGFRELTSISQGKDQLKISWQVLSGADRFE
jgi:subtilisin family serine protease